MHCVARLEEGQILLTDGSGIKEVNSGPLSEEEKELQARFEARKWQLLTMCFQASGADPS